MCKLFEWPTTLQALTLPFRAFTTGPAWKDVKSTKSFFTTLLIRLVIIVFTPPLAVLFCCINFCDGCRDLYPAYQRWQRRRQVRRRITAWKTDLQDFCSRHCQGFVCLRHHTFCYPRHARELQQYDRQTGLDHEEKCKFGCLLRLPPELRDRIYELAIEATWQSREADKSPSSWSTVKEEHPLLLVSRQVRQESMPLFYATSRFNVRIFEDQAVTLKRNPGIIANSAPSYSYSVPAGIDEPRISPWIYRLPAKKFRRIRHLRLEFHSQLSWADHWDAAVFDLDYHHSWRVTRVPPSGFPWWCMESWRDMEVCYQYRWVNMVHNRIHGVLMEKEQDRERVLQPEDLVRMACVPGELVAWEGRDYEFGPGRGRLLRGPLL